MNDNNSMNDAFFKMLMCITGLMWAIVVVYILIHMPFNNQEQIIEPRQPLPNINHLKNMYECTIELDHAIFLLGLCVNTLEQVQYGNY
jgi:hypothetical protein